MVETSSANDGSTSPPAAPGWPRWAAVLVTASGLVIILAETTSLLFFAGLLLVAFGIYGLVSGVRSRRYVSSERVRRSGMRSREDHTYGG
jgi:hypothetical protein